MPTLLPVLNRLREGRVWVEPFVGGCNVLVNQPGCRIAGDGNPFLIALLTAVRDGWVPPEFVTRDQFMECKHSPESFDPALVGYVGTCAAWGGLWLRGFAGGTHTTRYRVRSRPNLLRLGRQLDGVSLYAGSYETIAIPSGAFVYCDPPYKDTTGYLGSASFDHDKFWCWAGQVSRFCKLAVSERVAPPGWVSVMDTTCSLVCKGYSKEVPERLFVMDT